ncbi:hypothetical protein [Halobellus clavatus]|uniref:Uncharacterized protein n=1 Tax=Halobellus clavatus TaxID=660517 RepID=A0A1H3J6J9_9EURY|nr:hypothetical protein [Halobellus clavatus]SDY35613.1 hypothetical protein SAMN04487946_11247 [Halobellus clavatus]
MGNNSFEYRANHLDIDALGVFPRVLNEDHNSASTLDASEWSTGGASVSAVSYLLVSLVALAVAIGAGRLEPDVGAFTTFASEFVDVVLEAGVDLAMSFR